MTSAIIGITIAYAVLAVLLLNLNLYSRWSLWVKGGAIFLTAVLYFVSYLSLQGFLGWPTNSTMPKQFLLLSSHVEEPDEVLGITGGIYLWTLTQEGDHIDTVPRAYRMPYSQELHTQVSEAARQIKNGIIQMGQIKTAPIRGSGEPHTSLLDERKEQITIYDLPVPELPDK